MIQKKLKKVALFGLLACLMVTQSVMCARGPSVNPAPYKTIAATTGLLAVILLIRSAKKAHFKYETEFVRAEKEFVEQMKEELSLEELRKLLKEKKLIPAGLELGKYQDNVKSDLVPTLYNHVRNDDNGNATTVINRNFLYPNRGQKLNEKQNIDYLCKTYWKPIRDQLASFNTEERQDVVQLLDAIEVPFLLHSNSHPDKQKEIIARQRAQNVGVVDNAQNVQAVDTIGGPSFLSRMVSSFWKFFGIKERQTIRLRQDYIYNWLIDPQAYETVVRSAIAQKIGSPWHNWIFGNPSINEIAYLYVQLVLLEKLVKEAIWLQNPNFDFSKGCNVPAL